MGGKLIPVYEVERQLGLGEAILKASITHASQLTYSTSVHLEKAISIELVGSRLHKQPDLHYLHSILVSIGWNKNDDVFSVEEAWAARHSPDDKPLNFEHDNENIIGHMTSTWAIDEANKIIADDTSCDNLPSRFHLVNSDVIYKVWENKERQDFIDKLIAEIIDNQWYMSKETLFNDFDYAAITEDGQHKVIARNEQTAFLTKHLRAYGGDGTYQNWKIGRLLKSLCFCGKGVVKKPANPESIITVTDVFEGKTDATMQISLGNTTTGYALNSEDKPKEMLNTMAEANDLQKQIDELKASVSSVTKERDELTKQLAKVDSDKFEKQIAELTKDVETSKSALKDEAKKTSEAIAAVEKVTKENEALKASVTEATENLKKANDELGKIKAEKTKSDRTAKLIAGKVSAEKAAETVAKFEALSDEQFMAIAELAIEAAKTGAPKSEAGDETVDQNAGNADTSVIDGAKPKPEAALASDTSKSDAEKAQAELSEMIAANYLDRKSKKTASKKGD